MTNEHWKFRRIHGQNPILDVDEQSYRQSLSKSTLPPAHFTIDNLQTKRTLLGRFFKKRTEVRIYSDHIVQKTVRRINRQRNKLLNISSRQVSSTPFPILERPDPEKLVHQLKHPQASKFMNFVDTKRLNRYIELASKRFEKDNGELSDPSSSQRRKYTEEEAQKRAELFLTKLAAYYMERVTAFVIAHEHGHMLNPNSLLDKVVREKDADREAFAHYRDFLPAVRVNREALYQHLFVDPLNK